MVKYIEISNVFRAVDSEQDFLIFIADNALLVEIGEGGGVTIRINRISVEVATDLLHRGHLLRAVLQVRRQRGRDPLHLAQHPLPRRPGRPVQRELLRHEARAHRVHRLGAGVRRPERRARLQDVQALRAAHRVEDRDVRFPDFLLQVQSQQQLINLLDLAVYVRNVSFFMLVLFYLRRASIALEFIDREAKVVKIVGPWKAAIKYVLNKRVERALRRHLRAAVLRPEPARAAAARRLCGRAVRQLHALPALRSTAQYQIVPTDKQKQFLQRIICAEECFHFSEVGSGKTKVILPLLCQTFLSNNAEAHAHLARGGESKHVLIMLVPEHLVPDARDPGLPLLPQPQLPRGVSDLRRHLRAAARRRAAAHRTATSGSRRLDDARARR